MYMFKCLIFTYIISAHDEERKMILLMKYVPKHGREKKRKMRVLPTQGQSEESIISKIK